MNPIFDHIPLKQITPSKTNPRKYFNDAALADLAESIKTQGVAQPILVRPIKGKRKIASYEIIAGERRFRASKIVGIETIPALIRDLSDQQALEIQVIENLQRADLHPLEEAEGYEQLMRLHKMTADDLATKVGKSKSYVYTRLKLLALEPDARKAFLAGGLTPSTALLIARIPVAKLQNKAVKDIVGKGDNPMSTKSAAAYIQHNYMLQLDEAPFPIDDAALVASAGSCASCPKRTGNQPELFGDISCTDTCTDPECFGQKRAAHTAKVKANALEKGIKVFTGEEAKKIRPHSYYVTNGYVNLDACCYDHKDYKTYRELLGDDLPKIAYLEDPHTPDSLITIAKKDDAYRILIDKGILEDPTAAERERQEKIAENRKKEEQEKGFRQRLFDKLRTTSITENPALQKTVLRAAALEMIDFPNQKFICDLYGWKKEEDETDEDEVIENSINALDHAGLMRLLADILLFPSVRHPHTSSDLLLEMASLAGIDCEAMRADVEVINE